MDMTGEYQLHVLGDFKLERGGQTIKLPRRKASALLAYLALHPQQHRRSELATLLWADSLDAEARQSLRTTLATLRRELGSDLLIVDYEFARLNPTFPLWVDAVAFQTYAGRFLSDPPFDLSASFLDLYEGDLLPDLYDDWIIPERERLRSLYIGVLLHAAQLMRSHSDYGRAIQLAQRVLAIEPANERAHQHLMFCYVAMGNRSAALNQYQACQRALRDDLDVEPMPETRSLYQWIKGQPAHAPGREALITNLPIPLTSFVGRERELLAIKRALTRQRLVTLTGSGGSGKTRLAIEVGTGLLDAYKDGVWFVDLASIQDGDVAPQAVAAALGVEVASGQGTMDALVGFLRSRQTLLVLDNCEHVAAACAQLAETLLASCPKVSTLATSSVILGVAGELTWPIPALSLPADVSTTSLADLNRFESTMLFMKRAASAAPDNVLTDHDAAAVATICRGLDGMPLAIELAAARVKMLSPQQIADHLRDRFALLSSGGGRRPRRQESLRAAVDWSYDMLSSVEQALLRRLSVFVDGFSLAGATAVHGDGDETHVLDLLSRLVDHSLIVVSYADARPRYRFLETIRLYALDRLDEAGEKDPVIRRWLSYLCDLGEQGQSAWLTARHHETIQEFTAEFGNLRAAVAWCRDTNTADVGLRLVAPLYVAGELDLLEVSDWLNTMLSLGGEAAPLLRGRALYAAGAVARILNDHERGWTLTQAALALCRQAQDRPGIALALCGLGRGAMWTGKLDVAEPLLKESLDLFRELDYQGGCFPPLDGLARLRRLQGDLEGAAALAEQTLELARRFGHAQGLGAALSVLAEVALDMHDERRAAAYLRESLGVHLRTGWTREMLWGFTGLSDIAAAQGQLERSAILWGAAHAVADLTRRPLTWRTGETMASRIADVCAELGQSGFDALVAKGRSLTLEQAVAYALCEDG